MDCFISSNPNVTLLYDHNNDNDNLWMRNDAAGPLEPCFPLRPWQFPCTVCLHNGTVYAMCKKLADGVQLVMEAGGNHIRISKSDCPAPPADAPQAWIIAAVLLVLLVLVFIVMAVLFYLRNQKQACDGVQNDPEEAMLSVMPAEENHTPSVLGCCADGPRQHHGVQQVQD